MIRSAKGRWVGGEEGKGVTDEVREDTHDEGCVLVDPSVLQVCDVDRVLTDQSFQSHGMNQELRIFPGVREGRSELDLVPSSTSHSSSLGGKGMARTGQ